MRLVAGSLLILATAIASGSASPPTAWTDLEAELNALQQQHRIPVLVLVLVRSGEPLQIHVGTRPGQSAATPTTPFRWGSISKTVTAMAALEAARQHHVPLDAPVSQLLADPPYHNPWSPERPLQLAHLLELSAGLPDLGGLEFADNTPRSLAEALARGRGQRVLLWPPGLQHSYSNVPPGITAAVIEAITGLAFEAATARLVFEPLGMQGATFRPVPGLPGGFRADGVSEIPYWHVTFPAFGGLNASPAAMAPLLQALLADGRIDAVQAIAAATVDRMYRSETTLGANAGLEVGYGAGLYGRVRDGHVFYGHGGDADGYRSRLGLLPDLGRGYLVGINVDDPALLNRLSRRIEVFLTSDLTAPPVPPPFAAGDRALSRYAGRYYPASVRFGVDRWRAGEAATADIDLHDNGLRFRHGARTVTLLPVGPGRFRRRGDPAVTVVFVEAKGTLFLQGELGNFARIAPGCAGFVPACRSPGPNRAGG